MNPLLRPSATPRVDEVDHRRDYGSSYAHLEALRGIARTLEREVRELRVPEGQPSEVLRPTINGESVEGEVRPNATGSRSATPQGRLHSGPSPGRSPTNSDSAPGVARPGWIAVGDGSPKPYDTVAVSVHIGGGYMERRTGFINGDGKWYINGESELEEDGAVTHWFEIGYPPGAPSPVERP